MDISDDSKLIVTCSADKNIKIWGLDFGDCHKSIFAHDESIMQVAFEKGSNSHYFWTVSKDKLLKYWDGDKVRGRKLLRLEPGEMIDSNKEISSLRTYKSSRVTMVKSGL